MIETNSADFRTFAQPQINLTDCETIVPITPEEEIRYVQIIVQKKEAIIKSYGLNPYDVSSETADILFRKGMAKGEMACKDCETIIPKNKSGLCDYCFSERLSIKK
jgi:hypothetical protein